MSELRAELEALRNELAERDAETERRIAALDRNAKHRDEALARALRWIKHLQGDLERGPAPVESPEIWAARAAGKPAAASEDLPDGSDAARAVRVGE